MQTITPPPKIQNPKSKIQNVTFWGLVIVALTALYLLWPSGASLWAYDGKNNLIPGNTSPYTAYSYNEASAQVYDDWGAARQRILEFKVPLWDAANDRPLLAAGVAPVLYPPSLLYYFGGNNGLIYFALFHFWVGFIGLWVLARKLANYRQNLSWLRWFVLAVGTLGLLVLFKTRPDWQAAVSWLPWAVWLPLTGRRFVKLLALAVVLGLILTAVSLPLSLWLVAGVALWLCVTTGRGDKFSTRLTKMLLSLVVVLGIAFMLAGPQFYTRVTYNQERLFVASATPRSPKPLLLPYSAAKVANTSGTVDTAENQLTFSTPIKALQPGTFAGVEVTNFKAKSETELEYTIKAPAGNGPFFLVVPPQQFRPNTIEVYQPGWQGQLLTPTDQKPKDAPLYVSGEYRAVLVDPSLVKGETLIVRVRYNPIAFTLGIYGTFLGFCTIGLGLLVLAWIRFYKEDESDHPLRRIAKNSVTPMFAQFTGKLIDIGFAFFSLRLLGPEGNGRYTVAVTTWLIFNTISDFGLETLVTREVARDRTPAHANRYFSTMLVTRGALSLLSLPAALVWIGGLNITSELALDAAWAIVLLIISLLPNTLAGSVSALFRGYERFEFTAATQLLSAIIRVPLGLAALIVGWGVIGLAGTAVLVNVVISVSLYVLFCRNVFIPKLFAPFDPILARQLLKTSYPLMFNSLLVSLFFKADVFILLPFKGEYQVGIYNSAYKFIDGLLIIPSAITIALFPLFSRYSHDAKDSLLYAYREALRLLALISLPVSAGVLFVAHDLIGALGGSQYLPDGAIAFQILIWFLPFSYINGITQYVLISLDRQHMITWAVVATAVTNIALNFALIPFFGYIAASAMTVVSELVLLAIYYWLVRRNLAPIPLWYSLARPAAATLLMTAVLGTINWGLHLQNFVLNVVLGGVVYIVAIFLLRAVTKEDIALLKKIVKR